MAQQFRSLQPRVSLSEAGHPFANDLSWQAWKNDDSRGGVSGREKLDSCLLSSYLLVFISS